MLTNYFKTAWRNLRKNKLFSFINIFGLAIGMASTILLLGYAIFQLDYDDFHLNKRDIYRVSLAIRQHNNLILRSAENYSALGPALKNDFPEVISAARLYNMGYKNNCVFTYNNKYFKETKFLFADASFLTIFSFPFIEGDPKSALVQAYTAVISESFSKKFFNNQDAIGKYIQMDDDDRNSETCKITGVFKDIPENSHIKFNILISYPTLHHRSGGIERFENNWNQKDFYTYILLRPGTDPGLIESQFSSFIKRHIPGENTNQMESKLQLQPLQQIHLTSNLNDESEINGNGKAVLFLTIIAAFIITIAWVNYINLSTAASIDRAKEIGIRKVLGSKRSQLIGQFLTESLTVNIIGLAIAMVFVYSLQPLVHRLFGHQFSISTIFSNKFGFGFVFFLCLGAFFSGLYPAFVLSSFRPVTVLKGKLNNSQHGLTLRRFLVILQFSVSILLIVGTIIVYQQINYMLNKNLGTNLSQVLVMDRPGHWDKSDSVNSMRVQNFKEMLSNNPAIEAVAMANAIPGKEIRSQLNYRIKNAPDHNPVAINTIGIDEDYINVLGMHILAGRNFSRKFKSDEEGLIITISAAEQLGYKKIQDALGKQLMHNNINYTILGVLDDFHQQSLEKKIEPAIFQFNGNDYEADEFYLIKVKTTGLHRAVDQIQHTWNNIFKGNPFEFFFLDEYFNKQYKIEIQFSILFGIFSLIAIAIACIGLIALVAFMIKQRMKEISVRKVLGASMQEIIVLLTKDFLRLVLLANLIAWPLGWLFMNNWLKDFSYRINISWWVFIVAGSVALMISFITISFQAIKAALSNPVKSLRAE